MVGGQCRCVLAALGLLVLNLGPAAAQTPNSFQWTGAYVGVWAGGGWSNNPWSDRSGEFLGTVHGSGPLIGGYAGYNWQFGNIVAGIEGGAAWAGITGGFSAFGWEQGGYLKGVEEITGRVGFVAGPNSNWFFFAQGGAAFGQYSFKSDWPEIGTHFQTSKTLSGWVAGVGVEYRLTSNLSYRGEYRHYEYGSASADLTPDRPFPPYRVNIGQTSVDVLALGFNYYLYPGPR